MKTKTMLMMMLGAMACSAAERELFNEGWQFAMGSRTVNRNTETFADTLANAKKIKDWKDVTLPYDWAIYGPWEAWRGGDKLPWGNRVGWYRKNFTLAPQKGQRVYLDFDGVMAHSKVWLNGHVVGGWDYGYIGFRCDLTPYLATNGQNTVYVMADTRTMGSRWYPGAGIEKRVQLVRAPAIHFAHESIYVTTPKISAAQATIHVAAQIKDFTFKDETQQVELCVLAPDGTQVAQTSLTAKRDFACDMVVPQPRLWEIGRDAALYTLVAKVGTDVERIKFGIRSFEFRADEGFFLNGKRVQLNGIDLHTDMGICGMEFNRSVMRRQLLRMRDMGANALRTSHNAQAPELLELCDELGFFVWNECFDKWEHTCGRGEQNLEEFVERQLKAWTRRDRNHPSVFVWSIGNEITPSNKNAAVGTSAERCARFRAAVREFDATRPVGIGSCNCGDVCKTGEYDCLDIVGFNYGAQYRPFKQHMPSMPLLYSESASCVSSYGYYADTLPTNKTNYAIKDREVDSLDHNSAPWSDIPDKEFERMEQDKYVGGEFVWTGIDYIGEPFPYMHYLFDEIKAIPNEELARSAYFGICDLMALPKDRFYLYRAQWNKEDFTLHIAPAHWNFKAGNRPVYVYSSAPTVELFLNGKSLGKRTKDTSITSNDKAKTNTAQDAGLEKQLDPTGYYRICDRYRLRWLNVAYEPGELKAVAYDKDGKRVGEQVIHTAGEPVAVKLSPEEQRVPADGETYVFVRVNLIDKDAREVPNRSDFVKFALTGPGEIVAVGNGNPREVRRSFKETDGHWLYFGQAGLFIKRKPGSTEPLTLTASVESIKEGKVVLQ